MSVKLSALIKKAEAAIASELDPKKRAPIQSRLAVLMAAKAEMDDDDDDDDDDKKKSDDDDDDDEESKAAKAAKAAEKAKAKAEASKHKAKAAEHRQKAAEYDEAAKKCEEASSEDDDEDEARLRTPTPAATLSEGAAAAIASQGEIGREALTRIAKLEKDAEARNMAALINDARAARRITPGEAKTLAKKPASFVKDFLEMRPRALVATDEEALSQPDNAPNADVPHNVKSLVEQAVMAAGLEGEKAEKFRQTSYENHRKAQAGSAGVTH